MLEVFKNEQMIVIIEGFWVKEKLIRTLILVDVKMEG